jgi:hypothetical protein
VLLDDGGCDGRPRKQRASTASITRAPKSRIRDRVCESPRSRDDAPGERENSGALSARNAVAAGFDPDHALHLLLFRACSEVVSLTACHASWM